MFECVINISEGRDLSILDELSFSAGQSLRDRHHDHFHNRSVFTLINSAPVLLSDVHHIVDVAMSRLDLASHEGVHPRLGVVDVVPFVALEPQESATARHLRDDTARWIADTFDVPVFLYGALNNEERTLPFVRRHAFVDLVADFGPQRPEPHRGAVVVGARELLVAWNLWLDRATFDDAQRIAQSIRRAGVRALGLQVGANVQVSCNLVDLNLALPSQIFDQVSKYLEPPAHIARAELVGLIPQMLLDREDPGRWDELGLSNAATIESRIAPH